jgi:hypothetical protein
VASLSLGTTLAHILKRGTVFAPELRKKFG